MSNSVDFKFIKKWECSTSYGYIPAGNARESGVTIATGFDLGQHSAADLKNMGLSKELRAKLDPFLGQKKLDALDLLTDGSKKPQKKAIKCTPQSSAWIRVHANEEKALTLTESEVAAIDKAVMEKKLGRVIALFDKASTKKFAELPAEIQTAIASFCWQYGQNVGNIASKSDRRRKYWDALAANDWKKAKSILESEFSHKDKTRRAEEAGLLDKHIPKEASTNKK